MPIETYIAITVIGLIAGGYMFGMLLWSILYPERRVWPPKEKATNGLKFRVWFVTTTIFAAAFLLGVMDWNHFEWPIVVQHV